MKAELFLYAILVISLSGLSRAQSNNPCSGKWLGEIVEHPSRCDAYYVCLLTIPNLRTCDEGNVFDLSAKGCAPGNQETCEIYSQTTTTPPPPPPPTLDEICHGLFFAARPYPLSTTIYVGCIRESGILFHCFQDEVFDQSTNECVMAISN